MPKLYRSQRDKKLFGLCGGLAESFNVDVTLLRLVVLVTAIFSGGTVILLYFLASIVIPKEPMMDSAFGPSQPHMGAFTYTSQGYHQNPGMHHEPQNYPKQDPAKPDIDEMMKDVETKAMWKEIEELRARLAKYEKGDK